jgi:hypothetical protein
MENISADRDSDWTTHLCPRCGTVRVTDATSRGGNDKVYVPKLVARCRWFEVELMRPMPLPAALVHDWRRVGIRESINRPEDRPQ